MEAVRISTDPPRMTRMRKRLIHRVDPEIRHKLKKAISQLPQYVSGPIVTMAKEVGAGPEAARDVGQAMAKNPVALIIPCHRVLAAGGKVGGFSAPGGSAAKIRMLELEGVHVEAPQAAQWSFGF